MILRDRVCDGLQQHRLAGTRRRDDQSALSLTDRSEQIENACGEIVLRRFRV